MHKIIEYLAAASQAGKYSYLRCDPEIPDFTDDSSVFLMIQGSNGGMERVQVTPEIIFELCCWLKESIFRKDNILICWNLKPIISYFLAKTGKCLQFDCKIFDLKIIESYLGIKTTAPETLNQAKARVATAGQNSDWGRVSNIYKTIHLPLITEVIPHLENVPLLDTDLRSRVYANYEIDGQVNGRLLCSGLYKHSYVPHVLGPAERNKLKSRSDEESFLSFDFKYMEVKVLQWLTKDETLGMLLSKPGDFYIILYEYLTGLKSDENSRKFCKKLILPLIYGQSADSLSESLNLNLETTQILVSRIRESFAPTLSFIQDCQTQTKKTGKAVDYFGKCRIFKDNEYRVRNFIVQSPGALVCLEKLIDLHNALKFKTPIAFTVHDGYVLYVNKKNAKEVFKMACATLSEESKLCPGLKLSVTYSAGRDLNQLLTKKGPNSS